MTRAQQLLQCGARDENNAVIWQRGPSSSSAWAGSRPGGGRSAQEVPEADCRGTRGEVLPPVASAPGFPPPFAVSLRPSNAPEKVQLVREVLRARLHSLHRLLAPSNLARDVLGLLALNLPFHGCTKAVLRPLQRAQDLHHVRVVLLELAQLRLEGLG